MRLPNRRIRTRRLLGLALVALLATMSAACGDDDDAPSAAAGTETGETIRLGFSAWPGWFPWQVAEEAGLFDKAGLDVDLTYFVGYLDSLNALATGQLDANSQTLNDTISSVAGGAKQRIVLVNDNSTGNDQIVVAPGINSVADLKGKRVGAEEGTVDHYLLLLGLDAAGLTQADVDFKPLATDAAAAAFAAGDLDAVGVFAPFTTTALAREGSKALFTSADYPGAIPDHLVFDAGFVADHPAEVQKLVDVWFETIDYIKANPAASVAIMAKKAEVSEQDYLTYDQGTTIFDLDDNLAAFASGTASTNLDFKAAEIADFLLQVGLIEQVPDLSTLLDPTFVKAHKPA